MTEESIRSTVTAECDTLDAPSSLSRLIIHYLNFTIASCVDNSLYSDIYELLATCFGSFLGFYQFGDTQWLTPVLMNMSYSLVDWAIMADREKPNAKELKISDAVAKYLSRAVTYIINDKATQELKDSKKMGLFYLANLTFRVYFKASAFLIPKTYNKPRLSSPPSSHHPMDGNKQLHSTRLLPTMLANISKAGVDLSKYPMSQQVTHRYYLGRYHLYLLELRQTERELAFAFRNCPQPTPIPHTPSTFSNYPQDGAILELQAANKVIYNNARLIVIYLIAARLCLGRFPSLELLRQYGLEMYFGPLIRAVKLGDLRLLNQHLEHPEVMSWFVKKEIYFLLKEKLTVLCWRSLIRRMWMLARLQAAEATAAAGSQGQVQGAAPQQARVHLEQLLGVVQALTKDETFDIWDVECITASLLDQGYIKGYIHSEKKILVLGKTNPFPTVYSVEVYEEEAPPIGLP
ncbi:hypothetical protein BGX23_002962 [Mortierella sp. AD031]|nr:hypothetical protein BGX23_002962 [Mortierella sp. AD031]